MEDILELILSILGDFFGGAVGELVISKLPEEKVTAKARKVIGTCFEVLFGVLALILGLGVLLLFYFEWQSLLGWIFVVLGAVYVAFSIALGIAQRMRRRHKKHRDGRQHSDESELVG